MIYFDSAYIVKCYIPEHGSHEVRQVLQTHYSAACPLMLSSVRRISCTSFVPGQMAATKSIQTTAIYSGLLPT
jgi:hypothetical protein